MKNKKILSGLLACALICTSVTPAFATDITTSGGNSSVPVELTTEAATFSVTVPTVLPVDVDADGVVTTVDTAIVNNSHGAVKVTNMTIAGEGDWEIVDWDSADMAAEKVGATKVAMTINGDKTTADDTITFTEANFPKMDGANDGDTDELAIVYDAKVPAQAEALSGATIANVVFTVGWDTVEETVELITFTVIDRADDESSSDISEVYYAESGMTWNEFFTDYEKDGYEYYYYGEYDINKDKSLLDASMLTYISNTDVEDESSDADYVNENESIVANATYYIVYHGE